MNIADRFEEAAAKYATRPALYCGNDDISAMTYADLNYWADATATVLAESYGIGTGDRVGIMARNSKAWVIALLAIMKLRAVPFNVNYRYTIAEADEVLRIAQTKLVIGHRSIPGYDCMDIEGVGRADPIAHLAYEKRSGDDEFVVFTGGTTGAPKGVRWRHEDLIKTSLSSARTDTHVTMLVVPPLMHGSASQAVLTMLLSGNTAVLYEGSFDPVQAWDLITDYDCKTAIVVGDAMARPMAENIREAPWFEMLVSAGAVLSPDVKEKFEAAGYAVIDTYGSSELGGGGIGVGAGRFALPAGAAVVVDGRLAKPGEEGVVARTGAVSLGYLNDPVATAEAYAEIDGDRYVLTRDAARLEDDGTVTLLGRIDACINTGGEKVWAEEVEVVLRSHSAVRDALVVGVPHPEWGQEVTAVVAADVGIDEAEVLARDLQALCRETLAGYKVPKRIVWVDGVVRSPAGKPDYEWARAVAC